MLRPNWEDHDLETNPIISYFVDRQHTELILKNVENKIKNNCFYCKMCDDCNKLEEYRSFQAAWILDI